MTPPDSALLASAAADQLVVGCELLLLLLLAVPQPPVVEPAELVRLPVPSPPATPADCDEVPACFFFFASSVGGVRSKAWASEFAEDVRLSLGEDSKLLTFLNLSWSALEMSEAMLMVWWTLWPGDWIGVPPGEWLVALSFGGVFGTIAAMFGRRWLAPAAAAAAAEPLLLLHGGGLAVGAGTEAGLGAAAGRTTDATAFVSLPPAARISDSRSIGAAALASALAGLVVASSSIAAGGGGGGGGGAMRCVGRGAPPAPAGAPVATCCCFMLASSCLSSVSSRTRKRNCCADAFSLASQRPPAASSSASSCVPSTRAQPRQRSP
eukprot:SAG22_NODE_1702_length_3777_cov_30.547308_1_plen_323_part_00